MKYNLKIHLPQVVEELRQEYRSWLNDGNALMFLNSVEDVKEILRDGKPHVEFLKLLDKEETTYENNIKGIKQSLVKSVKEAIGNEDTDKLIDDVGMAIQVFDGGLQAEQVRYLEQLKVDVLGYMPHVDLDDGGE